MTVYEWLGWARKRLDEGRAGGSGSGSGGSSDSDSESDSVVDAESLLGYVTAKNNAALIADATQALSERQAEDFQFLVERRVRGEPIAYLIGEKEFWSLPLTITPAVLIPRAETELLVEIVLKYAARQTISSIVELGTGSGAIAIALASEMPDCRIVATDISASAIELAESNGQRLLATQAVNRVEFFLGDWFDAVPAQRFDLVVSNPPYVASSDHHLQQGDLRFEPRAALESGADGLTDLRRIITSAPGYLTTNGALLVEHGYDQAAAVRELFVESGFMGVATECDLGGVERTTHGVISAG